MSKMPYLAALLILAGVAIAGCGTEKSIALYNDGVDAAAREDYEEAARLFALAVQRRPDDPQARYNLGLAYIELKRYGEAEVHLREAAALDPMDHEAQELLGRSLEKQGKLVEAKSAYRASLNIKPTHVPALLGLASIALAEKQNRAAQDYATEASDLDPNNLEANVLLSEAYFRNGEYNSAYGQILTAKRLKPSDEKVQFLFGKIAYSRRMYEDALDALSGARSLGLTSDELFQYLGLTYLALGSLSDAEREFRLSIYKNDANAGAWRGLSETYMSMKKWPEAKEAISRAEELDPDNAQTMLDGALISINTGDAGRAAADLEALISKPGAPQVAGYYLGHAYLRLGRAADARAAFERFIAIYEGGGELLDEARAIVDRLSL